MKILILQLARFGDILMTGPVIKALRKKYPESQIDLVVREKFYDASMQLEGFDKIHKLSTAEIVGPMIETEMNEGESFKRVHSFVQNLRSENYSEIINLSFSPVSSWLTKMVAGADTNICGYSRFADGSFKIADEASEYFYAQVGVGQHNRFHLINIMGAVAGVDITVEDILLSKTGETRLAVPPNAIAIHIGASQAGKKIPTLKWISLIREFGELHPETPLMLLGSEAERADAEKIAASSAHGSLFNFVGKTQWSDVIAILKKCNYLIAGDSSLVQASNLVGTPCFNISNPTVNFWETGPRTAGSFVYFTADFEMLNTKDIAAQLGEVIAGWSPDALYRATGTLPAFSGPALGNEFQWALIAALYWGEDFPALSKAETEALKHLADLNGVVIENLQKADKIDAEILNQILKRADEIQALIAKQFPDLQPLFSFFDVERIKIGPGTRQEVIAGMIACHERCLAHLHAFLSIQETQTEMVDGQL